MSQAGFLSSLWSGDLFSGILPALNSALNPFIYLMFNSQIYCLQVTKRYIFIAYYINWNVKRWWPQNAVLSLLSYSCVCQPSPSILWEEINVINLYLIKNPTQSSSNLSTSAQLPHFLVLPSSQNQPGTDRGADPCF